MTSLRDFIAARLDEAQNDAETRNTAAFIHETGCYYYNNQYDPAYCDCDGPEHALREVAAKRAILETVDPCPECLAGFRCVPHDSSAGAPSRQPATEEGERLLKLLATPYSDHSDFDPNWSTT